MSAPLVRGRATRQGLERHELECLGELPLALDPDRIRVYRLDCGIARGMLRRVVLALSGGRAVALGNHVFLPARCEGDLAILAHELTHCAQYQAWGPWRYFTRGLVEQLRALVYRRLGVGESPYAYRLEEGKAFEAYGMEQQGQIVEDSFRGGTASGRARPATPLHPPGSPRRGQRLPADGPPTTRGRSRRGPRPSP